MTRAAVFQPPIPQRMAEVLVQAFAPNPGAQLVSIVADNAHKRLMMRFRINGQIAECVAVLQRVGSVN